MKPEPHEVEYFIGIGLPKAEERLLADIKKQYHPTQQISSPPHITLIPPFMQRNERYVLEKLASWAWNQTPFTVVFQQIGSFTHREHGTVFLQPDSGELIKQLESSLRTTIPFLENVHKMRYRPFTPHLTLAQRIPKTVLTSVKGELRALHLSVRLEVTGIAIYLHTFKQPWTVLKTFPFGVHPKERALT